MTAGARQKRYAFVLPRFGEDIIGGAETLAGALARRLADRGDDVEVFTTCARDNRSWENYYPAGAARSWGLPVQRFPVADRNVEVWLNAQIAIAEGLRVDLQTQLDWMQNGVNSRPLYEHIAAVAPEFDAVFFAPYLFATTFFGALIHPHKSVLIPCLHDEHYAYLDIMQSLFRQVRGALFNSAPEMELAQRLYRCVAGGEVGMGFDLPSQQETSSIAPYFKEEFPYIVYLGRKETGKGAHLLIDHFCALKAAHEQARDLRLVVCGGGDFKDLERPEAADRDDIIDLTLTESEKLSLLRHALFLAQPSVNESFSIVLMEAWLLGTPVVVNAFCPVTRSHAAESGGGLYFGNQAEFCAVSLELLTNRDLATAMGQAGREYVQNRYNWDAVLARFDDVMQGLAEKA